MNLFNLLNQIKQVKLSRKLIITFSILSLFNAVTLSFANELLRENGVSAHYLPKRVANLDSTKEVKSGFMVTVKNDIKHPLERPVFTKSEDLILYLKTLPIEVIRNGLWVIITNPLAYSNEELNDIEQLKLLCIKENIPLFICRGINLPQGWERFN